MSESELKKALLRGEEAIDLETLTGRVIRRDRWRVFILSALCLVAWMMVVMLPWAVVLPSMAKVVHQVVDFNNLSPAQQASERQQDMLAIQEELKFGTVGAFVFSIGSMFVAALCTVLLVVVSRRATLRQLNARLSEISAQLKILAEKPG